MTIFFENREVQIINGSEKNFAEIQKIAEELPEVKEICRQGILICYENSREDIVQIEELVFAETVFQNDIQPITCAAEKGYRES